MPEITYQVIQKPIEERILDAACIYWEVEREYFYKGETKGDSEVVYRRRIVFYLTKYNSQLTLPALASKFGMASHSRVAEGIETIEMQKKVLGQVRADLNQIQHLADKLDADFITTSIKLINNKVCHNTH